MAPSQTSEATNRVYYSRSGEILEAHRPSIGRLLSEHRQPSTAPFPSTADRINQSCQDRAINQVGFELHSTGNGTRHDGRCRRGKDRLEEPIHLRTESGFGAFFHRE